MLPMVMPGLGEVEFVLPPPDRGYQFVIGIATAYMDSFLWFRHRAGAQSHGRY